MFGRKCLFLYTHLQNPPQHQKNLLILLILLISTVSEEPEFVVGLGDARVKQGEPHEVSFVVSGEIS